MVPANGLNPVYNEEPFLFRKVCLCLCAAWRCFKNLKICVSGGVTWFSCAALWRLRWKRKAARPTHFTLGWSASRIQTHLPQNRGQFPYVASYAFLQHRAQNLCPRWFWRYVSCFSLILLTQFWRKNLLVKEKHFSAFMNHLKLFWSIENWAYWGCFGTNLFMVITNSRKQLKKFFLKGLLFLLPLRNSAKCKLRYSSHAHTRFNSLFESRPEWQKYATVWSAASRQLHTFDFLVRSRTLKLIDCVSVRPVA